MATTIIIAPSPPLNLPLRRTTPFLSPSLGPRSFSSLRATADSGESPPSDSDPPPSDPDAADFEARLARVRYRSGQGKKAELRKARKARRGGGGGAGSPSNSSGSGSGVLLPPAPLKQAVSAEGMRVEFGFSPYSERVNGRVAMLGLSALLLVELATGRSVISYHTPPILFLQIYFVAAVAAVYLKYDKERISVWPQSSPPKK